MNKPRLSVLITNMTLNARGGTEVVTRNAALGLLRAGHHPVVYSPAIAGPIARELRNASIPVTDDIRTITQDIDIIHGHHTAPTATAIARFPSVPAVFFCHDFTAWHDAAPHFPTVGRYVGVDQTTADRLTFQEGIPADKVCVLLNAVDLERCRLGPGLPESPRTALILAKNTGHVEPIKAACAEMGIAVDVIGRGINREVDTPETYMAGCDLVFGSALGALEALACGRAVVACDGRGLAGMVVPEKFDQWRRLNFGVRSLLRGVTVEAIKEEICKYDRVAAEILGLRLRSEAGLQDWVQRLTKLYYTVLAEHQQTPTGMMGMSLSMATHLQSWQPKADAPLPWVIERQHLLRQLEEASAGTAVLLGSSKRFDRDSRAGGAQMYGFGEPEVWGVWSVEDEAAVVMRLADPPGKDLLAEINFVVFLADGHPGVEIEVLVNGILAEKWSFSGSKVESHTRTITLKGGTVRSSRTIWFAFKFSCAISPMELGMGRDERKLALGLTSIKLDGMS